MPSAALFTANVGYGAANINRDKSRPTAPDGNVGCSMGWADPKEDGVRCYAPNGDLIGKIHVPETVANLTFGGMRRNRLYVCGSTPLYACYTSARGAMKP